MILCGTAFEQAVELLRGVKVILYLGLDFDSSRASYELGLYSQGYTINSITLLESGYRADPGFTLKVTFKVRSAVLTRNALRKWAPISLHKPPEAYSQSHITPSDGGDIRGRHSRAYLQQPISERLVRLQ
jgi:hypothetical protein